MENYHVYGIGNALVDMELKVTEDFLKENNIDKGLMTLIDRERQDEVLDKIQTDGIRACGGSAANTLIAISQFGGQSFYSCKVANDEAGEFYFNDLQSMGVKTNASEGRDDGVTGKCLVMVTPDADRTMNTFLGITSEFSVKELRESELQKAKYLYIEGYLIATEEGRNAMKKAKELAKSNGVKVALSLSDPNMVTFFKDQMTDVIGDGVDLLFCNQDEATTFTGETDMKAACEKLKKMANVFAVTMGPKGAFVWDGQKELYADAISVKAVDSNGAGDMFAGAFLYALTHGHDLQTAANFGCLAASKIVSKYGPRLTQEEAKDVYYEMFKG